LIQIKPFISSPWKDMIQPFEALINSPQHPQIQADLNKGYTKRCQPGRQFNTFGNLEVIDPYSPNLKYITPLNNSPL
jgi:hypothetical protein